MPFGEEFTSTVIVEVAGTPLPDDVSPLLVEARIDDSTAYPDLFALTFADDKGTLLSKVGIEIGAAIRLRIRQSGPRGPVDLMLGEVTTLEREVSPRGLHTLVRGLDISHRLFRGTRVATYVDSTPADVIRTVAQRANIPVGSLDSRGAVIAHLSQEGVDDWTFLRRLAASVGGTISVTDGILNFTGPADAADAPGGGVRSRDDPLVLQQGANVLDLRATVTSAGQVPAVELRGWDVEQKEPIVSVAPSATTSAVLAQADPASLGQKFASPRLTMPMASLEQTVQFDAAAESMAARLAGSFAELEGTIRGNPKVKAGAAVTLEGFGAPFDGRYTVSSSTHHLSATEGYLTSFSVSSASDRSLYGIVSGGDDGTPGARSSIDGVMQGIVSEINDPQGLGRVKISIPQLADDYVTWWARTVQLGAGSDRGWVVLPEVGDEVLVAFEQGSIDHPYVLGGLFNGRDMPERGWGAYLGSTFGAVERRSFTSRSGMSLVFDDRSGGESIVVSSQDGSQKITLEQGADRAIRIVAQGPVSIEAQNDVTISASGAGNLALSGNRVSIEGRTGVDVSGPTVTMKGSATAEISSQGSTTVRGAVVRIN